MLNLKVRMQAYGDPFAAQLACGGCPREVEQHAGCAGGRMLCYQRATAADLSDKVHKCAPGLRGLHGASGACVLHPCAGRPAHARARRRRIQRLQAPAYSVLSSAWRVLGQTGSAGTVARHVQAQLGHDSATGCMQQVKLQRCWSCCCELDPESRGHAAVHALPAPACSQPQAGGCESQAAWGGAGSLFLARQQRLA